MLGFDTIQKAAHRPVHRPNAMSFLNALTKYGAKFGLDKPHRFVQLAAQVMHESGEFHYDKEVWGPTKAQDGYDTRTDLGNTPAMDGDGKKYMGRGPIQITGKYNNAAFTKWCRETIDPNAPDFVANPDLINTDPWEGLSVIWYWSTRNLNKYADTGNIEMITKKINGGLNGYEDRIKYYVRLALVVLGYAPTALEQFQSERKLKNVDGIAGPVTRAELHKALVALVASNEKIAAIADAPVVEVKAVTPPQIDKPVTQTTGFWERIVSIGGLSSIAGFAPYLQDWRVIVALAVALIVLAIVGLFLHKRIIDAVKSIKDEVKR